LRHRPREVRRVLIAAGRGGGRRRELEALARKAGVAVAEAPASLLAQYKESVHNGFLAEVAVTAAATAEPAAGDPQFRVLLEDVQDPRNLGAVLRVCDGAGVGRTYIRDRGSAPLSPVAVKASAGAADWHPVERITNSGQLITHLKKENFWVYGAAMEGDPVWEVDLTGPVLLCFGGEEKGLRHRTRDLCDRLIALPMAGRVESLNIATAAAAVLFEAVRQRQK
jgi:23S rRNA (guanosine2251-2'-O)-methyltransferase